MSESERIQVVLKPQKYVPPNIFYANLVSTNEIEFGFQKAKQVNPFSDDFPSSDGELPESLGLLAGEDEEDISESIKKLKAEIQKQDDVHSSDLSPSKKNLAKGSEKRIEEAVTVVGQSLGSEQKFDTFEVKPGFRNEFSSFGAETPSEANSAKFSDVFQVETPRDADGSFTTVRSTHSRLDADFTRRKTEKTLKTSNFREASPLIANSVGTHASFGFAQSNIYNFLVSRDYSAFRTLDLNSALFLAGLLADHARAPMTSLTSAQKSSGSKPKIVIDLFNTLVYCGVKSGQESDKKKQLAIRCRPFLKFFLESMREKVDIVIFSGAEDHEVRKVAKFIDPKKEYFSAIYSKKYCRLDKEGRYIKDIEFLTNSEEVLFIDQRFTAFRGPSSAFVPIKPFKKHDKADEELLKLCEYLEMLLAKKGTQTLPFVNGQHLQFEKFLSAFNLKGIIS